MRPRRLWLQRPVPAIAYGALAALLALASRPLHAADVGADSGSGDERFTVIKAGKIITVSGKDIDDGLIVIVNGKIRNVGRSLEYPGNAKVIDASDRVVMPGLINPHSRFRLPPTPRDGVQADKLMADEYFPHERDYEVLLDAGYTTIALTPLGPQLPGRALVTRTGGPDSQRVLRSPAYLKVAPDKKAFLDALDKAQKEIEKVEKARKEFDEKQKQAKAPPASQPAGPPGTAPATQPASAPASQPVFTPPPIESAYQPLVELIEKKEGAWALIELRGASDYLHFADVLKRFEIAHAFVCRNVGRSDLFYVAQQLSEKKAPIVLCPSVNQVPFSAERVHVVRELSLAGCEVSLAPLSDADAEQARVLRRTAELVRDGWPRGEALKALTLHPARLLGLDKRLGSIEKDKDADLIFLDQDPLRTTARVREVMIAGEIVRRVKEESR